MEGFSIQKLGFIWFNYPETGNIYTKIHSEFLVKRKVEICRMGVLKNLASQKWTLHCSLLSWCESNPSLDAIVSEFQIVTLILSIVIK